MEGLEAVAVKILIGEVARRFINWLLRRRPTETKGIEISALGSKSDIINLGTMNIMNVTNVNHPNGWATTDDQEKKGRFEVAHGYLDNEDYAQAIHAFEKCFAVATTDSERSSLHSYIASCFVILGRLDIAKGHCQEAEMVAQDARDLHGLAVAAAIYATILFIRQDPETLKYFNKARELSQQAGYKEAEVSALIGSTLYHILKASYDEECRAIAWQNIRYALELAESAGDEPGQAGSLAIMALLHLLEGQLPQAMEVSSKAISIARKTGQRSLLASTLLISGIILLISDTSGHIEKVLPIFQEGLAISKNIGHRVLQAIYLSVSSDVLGRMGERKQALEFAREAQQIFQELGADVFKDEVARDVQRLSNEEA